MKTSCHACGRTDVAVLPCTRYLPTPHVKPDNTVCWRSLPVVHEAHNIERIARIWEDDSKWDLREETYVWP